MVWGIMIRKQQMAGETNLKKLIQGMSPTLHEGEYVFAIVSDLSKIDRQDTICEFKEKEGTTVVIERKKADDLKVSYEFVASWITLEINSSLEAVGLTAAFSTALAELSISCNVIAGFYHDHIFVNTKDAHNAMEVLKNLSNK